MNYYELLDKVLKEIPFKQLDKPYGIVFIGGPGYGKSTISKILSEKLDIYVTANDRIRRIFDSVGVEQNQELLEKIAEARTIYMLENKIGMIIDANMQFHYKKVIENFNKYNTKLYFIKIDCSEEEVLRRIKERKKLFDKDNSIISRAVEEDYYKYKERCLNNPFDENLVFYAINGDESIENITKQIENLCTIIKEDLKK